MVDRRLIEAYQSTKFVVDIPGGQIVLRVTEPNHRIDALLRTCNASTGAFITACNPRSVRLESAENARRHEMLVNRVRKLGHQFFSGRGIGMDGDWPPEESVFIVAIKRSGALELGRDCGQNAIVFKEVGRSPELVLCIERNPDT
jgi:hypothetical protein